MSKKYQLKLRNLSRRLHSALLSATFAHIQKTKAEMAKSREKKHFNKKRGRYGLL